jgi:hypothetical protein
VFCGIESDANDCFGWGNQNLPPRQSLEAFGYDPNGYIATAALQPSDYTNQANIIGRVGGELQRLIPATDDDGTGNLNKTIFNSILANVTTEINGLISSIYPIPLAKTGTVAIVRVTGVDSSGAITSIDMVSNGAYLSAPASPNSPAYLRYSNASSYGVCWGWNWNVLCQKGTGASLTVAFTNPTTPALQTPISVTGVPAITNGGTGYQTNDLLVLTGGTSFVPDKIINAATTLFCYELLRRRLVPDEKNLFDSDAKEVKKELLKIANGELVMDGTYRDFFGPVAAWVQQSVLGGNSL